MSLRTFAEAARTRRRQDEPAGARASALDREGATLDVPPWAWAALLGAVTAMLVIDLLVVQRRPHVIGVKAAA